MAEPRTLARGAPTRLAAAMPSPAAPASLPSIAASLPTAPPIGVVATTPPAGEMSRRRFLRRMLAAGVGLFCSSSGSAPSAFLWPQIRPGLGAKFKVGTIDSILATQQPYFANGWPYAYGPARVFLVNVPAAKELALGNEVDIPTPVAADLLALWRKCPHLGCLVPAPCESSRTLTNAAATRAPTTSWARSSRRPGRARPDRFAVLIEDDGMIVIDTAQYTQGPPNLGPDHLTFYGPLSVGCHLRHGMRRRGRPSRQTTFSSRRLIAAIRS